MNNFIDHEIDLARVTAVTTQTTEPGDPDQQRAPRALSAAPDVACYENHNLYNELIDASAELIPEGSPLLGLIAKQFTSSCWREERQTAVSVDVIDLRVALNYEETRSKYPHADARLHGSLATMELLNEGVADRTDRAVARAVNTSRTKLSILEKAIALREKYAK